MARLLGATVTTILTGRMPLARAVMVVAMPSGAVTAAVAREGVVGRVLGGVQMARVLAAV
jgi:hypothetical protein